MAEPTVVIPIRAQDDASAKLKRVSRELDTMRKKLNQSTDAAKKSAASSADVAKGFRSMALRAAGAVVGITAVYRTIRTGIADAIQAERANRMLENQFRALGVTSNAVVDDLKLFAGQLASQTNLFETDVIELTRLVSSFGVYGDQLKQTTAAVLDLSAAMGIDQKAAALAVGKAIQGQIGGLSRYGITIENAATPAERLTNLLNKMRETGFSGAAARDIDTTAGAMRGLTKQFREFWEAVMAAEGTLGRFVREVVENLTISVKAVRSFLIGPSDAEMGITRVRGLQQQKALAKEIEQTNRKLTDQAEKSATSRAKEEKALKEIEALEKDRLKQQQQFSQTLKTATTELMTDEEKINAIYAERIAMAREMASQGFITQAELQSSVAIFRDAFIDAIDTIEKERLDKAKDTNADVAEDFQTKLENVAFAGDLGGMLSALGGGGAAGAGALTGVASALTGIGGAISSFQIIMDLPKQIEGMIEGLIDSITGFFSTIGDWFGALFSSAEWFQTKGDAVNWALEQMGDRVDDLKASLDRMMDTARTSSELVNAWSERVSIGQDKISGVIDKIDALIKKRTMTDPFTGEEWIKFGKGSRREMKEYLEEVIPLIEQQGQLLVDQYNANIQQIREEYAEKRAGLLEQISLAQEHLAIVEQERDRLRGLLEDLVQGFQEAKMTVAGALLSPQETTAAAWDAFRTATGEDKAAAAERLQQSLLDEFQSAQEAAAAGLITQEELTRIQADILGQLEAAEAEATSEAQRLLDIQQSAVDRAHADALRLENELKILNEMEAAAIAEQKQLLQNQLQALKDIKNVLENRSGFQHGGIVEESGLAFVHKGETVLPPKAMPNMINISINGQGSGGRGREMLAKEIAEILRLNTGNLRQALKRAI